MYKANSTRLYGGDELMADIIPFNKEEREKNKANKVTVELRMVFTPDGFGIIADNLKAIQVTPDGTLYFVYQGVGPVCAIEMGDYRSAIFSASNLQSILSEQYNVDVRVCKA